MVAVLERGWEGVPLGDPRPVLDLRRRHLGLILHMYPHPKPGACGLTHTHTHTLFVDYSQLTVMTKGSFLNWLVEVSLT